MRTVAGMSLVYLLVMAEPAGGMFPVGVVMRPMDDAPLLIPFVNAAEIHAVASLQSGDPFRQIDVVRHHQALPGRQPEKKLLMTAPDVIIRQHAADRSVPFDLYLALTVLERVGQYLVSLVDARNRNGFGWGLLRKVRRSDFSRSGFIVSNRQPVATIRDRDDNDGTNK